MRLNGIFSALALASVCFHGSAALAETWQIATVSGKAFRLDGTTWVRIVAHDPLALGDTVKTLGSGSLTLTRSGVTVTVGPDSQVQIAERMDGKFTDVFQTAGSASVEVDPGKHIHLAVETPYMAAVVKGTVFSVTTVDGYSQTAVARGRVGVIDVRNRLHADVTAGQTATSGPAQPLSVSGIGRLAAPKTFRGQVMTRAADGTLTEASNSGNASSSVTTTVNGAGKTVTSHAGGNSNGAGNSENSNAGGNAGGNSGNSNAGGNGNGNSGSNNAGGNSNGAGNSSNSNAGGKSK